MTPAQRDDFERRYLASQRETRAFAMYLTRNRADADELLQTAALKALRFYDRFDGGCFAAWFTTILKREFVSLARAARRHRSWEVDSVRYDEEHLKARGEDAVLGIQLAKFIAELPERQREIFRRHIIEQHECREIAEAMSLPIGTVMTNVFRARQKLQLRIAA